jgi:hypothetical protein
MAGGRLVHAGAGDRVRRCHAGGALTGRMIPGNMLNSPGSPSGKRKPAALAERSGSLDRSVKWGAYYLNPE